MSLKEKLHLADGQRIRIVNEPDDVKLGPRPETNLPSAEAVLLFVRDRTELLTKGDHAFVPAQKGKPTWLAFPKDLLDKDVVDEHARRHDVHGAEEVELDDAWTAIRLEK